MNYLDFVIEHYIWFLIGGIVLLMTIIGYYAEKTEFGKKSPVKKSKKKDKPIEFPVEPKSEPKEEPVIEEEPMENLDPIDLEQVVDPEVLNEKHNDQQEESSEVTEEIPEDLYVGLDGTPNTYKDNKVEDTEEPDGEILIDDLKKEDSDLELPNIDALKDDTYEGFNDDEDMWKF